MKYICSQRDAGSGVPKFMVNIKFDQPIQLELLHGIDEYICLLLVCQIRGDIADTSIEDFRVEYAHIAEQRRLAMGRDLSK